MAGMVGEPDERPKVTPFLLRRADDMCPRRLDCEFHGADGHRDPVNRGRVRSAFIEAARTAHTLDPHARASWPTDPALTPEETAVFDQAVHWYLRLFGERAVALHDHDLDRPSDVAGLDVRVGGWLDLTVVDTDGTKEVRLLDFWGRPPPPPDELLDDWTVRLALLRLVDWIGSDTARVSVTDLLHGVRSEREVDPTDALPLARASLERRVADLDARASADRAEPGRDCGTCRFHKGCPEFPRAMRIGQMGRTSLLPGLLPVTPSSLEAWHRCRRLWRTEHLLSVPRSDDASPSVHGQQVHDLVRLLHQQGPCDDPARIDDIVAAHGASDRVHAELTDHARRCPLGAQSLGHELTVNRLHPRRPSFIASARIDAAWMHDGLLDVRDYKTGGVAYDRVADDPRARLQAWVIAPVAEAHGLTLRVRYEQLAAEIVDDPDEWEPEADDLDAVGDELRAAVDAMRSERDWHGVNDPIVCRYCRYRSICPDSAVPGVAAWPRVDDDPDASEADGQ